MPSAGTGRWPSAQPTAGAILTVGIAVWFGGGSCGVGPKPASEGSLADSPHAPSAAAAPASSTAPHKREDGGKGLGSGMVRTPRARQDAPATGL
ncbi:hypothetical protein D9M71_774290 [compost metagenome]